jgi:hypothetical protein
VIVINDDVVRGLHISLEVIEHVAEEEGRELLRREQAYRDGRPPPDVSGKVVILVDDGLATGSSMSPTRRSTGCFGKPGPSGRSQPSARQPQRRWPFAASWHNYAASGASLRGSWSGRTIHTWATNAPGSAPTSVMARSRRPSPMRSDDN